MKGHCNKSLKILFSRGIEDLLEDNFEGSMDEQRIFREVFLGRGNSSSSKRCLVTGAINFENDKSKHKDVSLCSNSDNSVTTSQEDLQNAVDVSGSGCLSEECALTTRNDPNVEVKRMKLSVEELSNAKPYLEKVVNSSTSSKEAFSHLRQPASVVVCHLVESSGQGVKSSCYLLKGRVGEMAERSLSKCRLSNPDANDQKAIVASKAIASPVSQESHASKLLACNPESLKSSKPRWKESCFIELDKDEMPMPNDSTSDPRPLLRYHIHRLLRAAEWVIGRRKRSARYRGLGEYVYKSPEGRPIREFYRAWNLCGQRLFADAKYVVQRCDDKQWTDLTEFRTDLSNTLTEIEENLNSLESPTALAHWWHLLDPFANVVFIEKTLGLLREGAPVKAYIRDDVGLPPKNLATTVNQIEWKVKTISDQPCGSPLVSESALTVFEEDSSIHKEHCLDDRFQNFSQFQGNAVKASKLAYSSFIESKCHNSVKEADRLVRCSCRSDSISCQICNCFLEVPVISENANASGGVSESVSPHQDSSISSLQRVNSHLVYLNDTELQSGYMGNEHKQPIGARLFRIDDPSFQPDGVLRSETHKKSKRISEIKLTALNRHDELGPSASYHGQSHEICRSSIQFELDVVKDSSEACVESDRDCNNWSLCSSDQLEEERLSRFNKLRHNSGTPKRLTQKKSMICQLKDDDLLLSAIIKSRSTTKRLSVKGNYHVSSARKKYKSQKGSCRLLPRSLNKGGKNHMERKWSDLGGRTVLSWLINTGVVYLKEVIQFRNSDDDAILKDGVITRDGILCRCCNKVLSVSEFKSHAGFMLNRPCLNLFMESGKSFALCLLEAWSAEYKVRRGAIRSVQVEEIDENDDSCGLCGDGGELICCDNCPSTFHQACLYAEVLPEGSWYCSQCSCWICGDVVKENDTSAPGALKCLQCEHKYHGECLKEKGIAGGTEPHTWFCGEGCQELYSGLHSQIGVMNPISAGFSWTLLRCIHGDKKIHSAQRIALKAECNPKLAVALTIMEECFLPMVDPRTGIDMIPHVLYNWGSEFARLNYEGFFTMVLEKDDVLLSVASVRIHGVTIAEMPLIATCSRYRRQGMCRRLMNAIEGLLKSYKVEKLVISAIPSLVETWTEGFGFTPLEDHERRSLTKTNLMVFPGTVWLKKPMYTSQEAAQNSLSEPPLPSEQGLTAELKEQCNTKLDLEEAASLRKEQFMTAASQDLQPGGDQVGSFLKDFSNLTCEEAPPPTLEGISPTMVCNFKPLEMYDSRELPLNEQSEKTDSTQRNL